MSRKWALGAGLLATVPLYRLTYQSLWYDELFTVWVARHPLSEIARQTAVDGFTPPLYYFLVAFASRLGLYGEQLRVLSVVFGALTLFGVAQLAFRLGGSSARARALVLAGFSPFLISFSQELRPYTAFLACAVWAVERFLVWRAKPRLPGGLVWAALLLLSVSFSYLGVALLPAALVAAAASPRPREALPLVVATTAVALVLSWPGLAKGKGFAEHRRLSGELRLETRWTHPFARLLLANGVRMAPVANEHDDRLRVAAESAVSFLLLVGVYTCFRERSRALAFALGALVLAFGAVWIADAVTGISITTRYLALAFLPFLLALALSPRWWPVLPLLALQAVGLRNYFTDANYFRDDWRRLCARLATTYQDGDLVWGFPVHHLEVARSLYAPSVPISGGSLGRKGDPVYLLKEGARFTGYDFEGNLERVETRLEDEVLRRVGGRRVLLVTYADEGGHGDTRPLVEALGSGRRPSTARFLAREVLLVRMFSPR